MAESLLKIEGLKTRFGSGENASRVVDDVSFEINKGETFALLGESGCGKSMTALSILQLIPEPAGNITAGRVQLNDDDILNFSEVAMRKVRGSRISIIFQEPMTSLNPVMTVGQQIKEVLVRHKITGYFSARKRAIELLDAVGIPDPARHVSEYPHQLSGGMKQRVMIAMALACEPDLLIADEPTTALDVTIQAQILDLLSELQKKTGMAILLITHDLGVVARMANRIGVMYAGEIVEIADRDTFFNTPRHPYSIKLFQSIPNAGKRGQNLEVIHGTVPPLNQKFVGCRFVDRCDYAQDKCNNQPPVLENLSAQQSLRCHFSDLVSKTTPASTTESPEPTTSTETLLKVDNLKVHFPIHKGVFKRVVGHVKAVDGIALNIPVGKTVALVGESGCGKTTVGKGILQLIKPTDGTVRFGDNELTILEPEKLKTARADIQFIFQDPFSSMNPRMRVMDVISEGMKVHLRTMSENKRFQRVNELLEHVGLSTEAKYRFPHEFSGGQRQRICIARALAVDPKLVICDEPTSALDVSVQAQILNLLKQLQEEIGLSYLFITHNLSVVEYFAHEVAVMYLGRIVEYGTVKEVFAEPKHPYTKALLSAVPEVELDSGREIIRLEGDMPSPANPPEGCYFHPRCPKAEERCKKGYPDEQIISGTHRAACFLYKN